MSGMSKANARQNAKSKRRSGYRGNANLPAKAGKRRPPNMVSKRDKHGTRQWEAVSSRTKSAPA